MTRRVHRWESGPPPGQAGRALGVCGYAADLGASMWCAARDRFTSLASDVTCAICTRITEEQRADVTQPEIPSLRIGCRSPARVREQGDDTPLRPRWASWRSALSELARWRDEGFPVRSTSDPSRFEALPRSTGETYAGDAGQVIATDIAIVSKLLAEATRHGWLVAASPRRYMTPELCASIVEIETCGSPRSVITRGKGRITLRGPCDDLPSFASVIAGWDVTQATITDLVRDAGAQIERGLAARGLVEAIDPWLHTIERREEDEVPKPEGLLVGWKAIANYLGWSVDRCLSAQRWYPPIPIVRVGANVETREQALDEWRAAGALSPSRKRDEP